VRPALTTEPVLDAPFSLPFPDTLPTSEPAASDAADFDAQLSTAMEGEALETDKPPTPQQQDETHKRLDGVLGITSSLDEGRRLHKLLDRMLERRALGGPPTREQLDVFKELLGQCTGGRTVGAAADRLVALLLGGGGGPVVIAGRQRAVQLGGTTPRAAPTRPQSGEPTLVAGKVAPDEEPPTQEARRRAPSHRAPPARPLGATQLRRDARARVDRWFPSSVNAPARERVLGILDRFVEARALGAQVLDPDAAVADLMNSLRAAVGTRMPSRAELDALFELLGLASPR
jgi:hypothetical protein